MPDSNPNFVVEIKNLSRTYGHSPALRNVDLGIPEGLVFGLVGKNGAGKTTLIKHIMGLLKAVQGSVSVFGMDPVKHPVEVLGQIGYMGETEDLPGWMQVSELIRFKKSFYPGWDDTYALSIIRSFEIDLQRKVNTLSKGQHARVALLLALAHKPRLIVLDEPSDGLDPLLRRDMLRAVIRTVADEGRTVLFSSHLLDEVERISDHVAMIDKGAVVYENDINTIRSSFFHVNVTLNRPLDTPPVLENCKNWEGQGQYWRCAFQGNPEILKTQLSLYGGKVEQLFPLNLNDAFIALVSDSRK